MWLPNEYKYMSHLYWSAEMWFSFKNFITIIKLNTKEIIARITFDARVNSNNFNNISSNMYITSLSYVS